VVESGKWRVERREGSLNAKARKVRKREKGEWREGKGFGISDLRFQISDFRFQIEGEKGVTSYGL